MCVSHDLTRTETQRVERIRIEIEKIDKLFTGTGDLFAALFLGYTIMEDRDSFQKTNRSAFASALLRTVSVMHTILSSPHNQDRPKVNNKTQELNLVPCGSIIREATINEAAPETMQIWETPVTSD